MSQYSRRVARAGGRLGLAHGAAGGWRGLARGRLARADERRLAAPDGLDSDIAEDTDG